MRIVSVLVWILCLAGGFAHADPTRAQAYYKQGIELEKAKKYADAGVPFVMALAEEPGYATVYRELGNCAYLASDKVKEKLKNESLAREYYQRYLAAYPGDLAIKKFLGGLYDEERKELNKEKKFETRAMQVAPGDYSYMLMELADVPHRVHFEKNLAAAKLESAKTGKPILSLIPASCRKPMAFANHSNGGAESRVKEIIYKVLNQPDYAAWIEQHYVLVILRQDPVAREWVHGLSHGFKNGSMDTERALVVAKSDLSDWRSLRGYDGRDDIMLFLVRSLQAFKATPAQAKEEVVYYDWKPTEGKAKISLDGGDFPMPSNYYFSRTKDSGFVKVNERPVMGGLFVLRGLKMDTDYYLRWAPLDSQGREETPGPDLTFRSYVYNDIEAPD
jgi:tetratricopeptide (TPR) repeat protein